MWTPGIGHETKRQECIAGGLPWKHGALIVTVTATALAIASVPADHKDVILVKLNLIPPHDGDEGPHRNRRGVGCECGVLVLSLPSRRALGAAACSWSRGVLLEPRRARRLESNGLVPASSGRAPLTLAVQIVIFKILTSARDTVAGFFRSADVSHPVHCRRMGGVGYKTEGDEGRTAEGRRTAVRQTRTRVRTRTDAPRSSSFLLPHSPAPVSNIVHPVD